LAKKQPFYNPESRIESIKQRANWIEEIATISIDLGAAG
jgi:hypothetical protein